MMQKEAKQLDVSITDEGKVIGMLRANNLSRCREIWLLHLSDANSDEREMQRRVQEETGIATYIA
jgi:hypothetical protein